jgi:hypothetical protein
MFMSTPENLPFSQNLTDTGEARLFGLENNPEILIRLEENVLSTEELQHTASLLDELQDTYGIKHPGYMPFIAAPANKWAHLPQHQDMIPGAAYIAVQKVHGTGLDQAIESGNTKAMAAAEELYSSLVQYVADKWHGDQEMLTDIFGNHQYMWGRVAGEAKDSVYLTDVGAFTSDFKLFAEAMPNSKAEVIATRAIFLFGDIVALKEKTGQDIPALEQVYDILDATPVDDEAIEQAVHKINTARQAGRTASADVVDILFE